MITCSNNNFQSPLNEGWDEDEEPAAAETKLDSWLSECLQSFQLLTLALMFLNCVSCELCSPFFWKKWWGLVFPPFAFFPSLPFPFVQGSLIFLSWGKTCLDKQHPLRSLSLGEATWEGERGLRQPPLFFFSNRVKSLSRFILPLTLVMTVIN